MYSVTTMRLILVIFFVQLAFLNANGQRHKRFFRKDYTYLESTGVFYKIHTIHRTWQDAKERCEMEGATLFYAEDLDEATVVLDFWNKTQPFYWVYVGISDLIAKGVFETVDGRPVLDVYSNWGPGEPNDQGGVEDCVILRREGALNDDRCDKKYPFICKKTIETLEWHKDCDIPYTDYVFNKALGRCYKFHNDPKNWTEAVASCAVEQSYLAIINSQEEADYLSKLTAEKKNERSPGLGLTGVVWLGFYKDGDVWKTIKGDLLDNTGYHVWQEGQPDGPPRGVDERHGTMFYNGRLNDIRSFYKLFYICEHDISSLANAIDDRFNNLVQ